MMRQTALNNQLIIFPHTKIRRIPLLHITEKALKPIKFKCSLYKQHQYRLFNNVLAMCAQWRSQPSCTFLSNCITTSVFCKCIKVDLLVPFSQKSRQALIQCHKHHTKLHIATVRRTWKIRYNVCMGLFIQVPLIAPFTEQIISYRCFRRYLNKKWVW